MVLLKIMSQQCGQLPDGYSLCKVLKMPNGNGISGIATLTAICTITG